MARRDRTLLSPIFIADLTLLIRIIGKWLNELCLQDNPDFVAAMATTGSIYDSVSSRSGQSVEASSYLTSTAGKGAYNTNASRSTSTALRASKMVETLGIEVVDSTAVFLLQLLLLIDRSYVLQRLRDLLTMLEIRHNMVGHWPGARGFHLNISTDI